MAGYTKSVLGDYGGLANYHGFGAFGEIVQGHIDAVIQMLQTAQGFFTQSQSAPSSVRPSFISNANSQLKTASSTAKNLADQLRREGKTRESGLLDTVFLEAHQMSVGQIGYDNFGRVIGLAKAAKTGLGLVAALTPQQSSATASRISQRQNALEAKIKQAGVSDLSKHAALQSEWAGISRTIRDASLLKADRDRLLARQNQLLSVVEKKVVAATGRTDPIPAPGAEGPSFWNKFTSFFAPGPSLSIAPTTTTQPVLSRAAATTVTVRTGVTPAAAPTRTVAPTRTAAPTAVRTAATSPKIDPFTGKEFKQAATGIASLLAPLGKMGTDLFSLQSESALARRRAKSAGGSAQNQAILAALMQGKPAKTDNTMLYVGVALGSLALLGIIVVVALK